ncbi:hypothetical protein [Deinococcus yunweiensis]|uniref:hypothetical protein n=1 Tax=Deinococcus yunweiensis TaxID=367282 RepID=UPI00398EF29B
MSRRDRQNAQRRIDQQRRRQALDVAISAASDWPTAARMTAEYEREVRGFVRVRDREPHYLCQLGLRDVCKGGTTSQQDTRHPDVITGHRHPRPSAGHR